MEDSNPHQEVSRENNRRRGRARRNIASRNPSSQETEDGPDKDKPDRRRDPEGEEGEYTANQRITEIGRGHARDHNKSQVIGTRGKQEASHTDRRSAQENEGPKNTSRLYNHEGRWRDDSLNGPGLSRRGF
jgi:hypothetical protein